MLLIGRGCRGSDGAFRKLACRRGHGFARRGIGSVAMTGNNRDDEADHRKAHARVLPVGSARCQEVLACARMQNWPTFELRMAELWTLLPSWVEINSFTGNPSGTAAMAEALTAAFALPGLRAHTIAGRGCGPHVVFATSRYTAGHKQCVLLGHHDTVFPPGGFVGFRRDAEYVYGPGVLDMKGGLAVIRTALAVLADAGLLSDLGVCVISVADEETGSADGAHVIEQWANGAQRALVFEAGRTADRIVVARKGTGKLRVDVTGRAAHAGNDLANGVNAIVALAQFIAALAAVRLDIPVTHNVGLIEGGTAANTVPAHASCEIDLRAETAEASETLLSRIRQCADEVARATGATFAFSGGMRRRPLEPNPASLTLAAHYGKCADRHGLGHAVADLVGGGSDANTTAALGIPSIDGLGPRGKHFHTPQEFAESASFGPKVRALLDFLKSLQS